MDCPENIIVRFPNWLGDFVMATPLIKEIKKKFPKCHLTALCTPALAPLLEKDVFVDEIHVTKPLYIKKILTRSYDIGLLLTRSFRSALWFFRLGVKKRIGYVDGWTYLLVNKPFWLKNTQKEHQIAVYQKLLSGMDIIPSKIDPYLVVDHEEVLQMQTLLQSHGHRNDKILITVNAQAAFGKAKCWLPERFQEVALRLIKEKNATVVFLGDQKSSSLVASICKTLPKEAIDLSGKTTIRQMVALIQASDLLLTNDSGPMHVASALKKPLVALFGSTSKEKTGPSSGTVVEKKVACSPCFKRKCVRDFVCMKQITSNEVFLAICQELEIENRRA